MMNKQQIKKLLPPFLRKHGVVRASLFGSIVRGEATEQSDVDILVDINQKEDEKKIREMGLSPEDEKEEIRSSKIVFSRLRLDISKKYGQGRG